MKIWMKSCCMILAIALLVTSCRNTDNKNSSVTSSMQSSRVSSDSTSDSASKSDSLASSENPSEVSSETSSEYSGGDGGDGTVYSTSSKSKIVESVIPISLTPGVKDLFSIADSDKNIVFDSNTLYYYDLHDALDTAALNGVSSTIRRDALDFIVTLQGIVNRDAPRLFIYYHDNTDKKETWSFSNGVYYDTPDKYWWDYLRQKDHYLANYNVVTVKSFGKVIDLFKSRVGGAIVWDPEVMSTSNVASTVAGVESLLPVRYETGLGLYDWFIRRNKILKVERNLVNLFSGEGTIPETKRASSKSRKCDAYLWALENYLKPGKTSPVLMQYIVDATLRTPYEEEYTEANTSNMISKDYYIQNKAFFFDLCVWEHIIPSDDRNQIMGTDYKTLTEILTEQNKKAAGRVTTVGGFIPFVNKYTKHIDPGNPDDFASEWRMIRVFSTYYMQDDGDAYKGMSNASIYSKIQMKETYSQNIKDKDPVVNLENKNYLMFYMGDYDGASYVSRVFPGVWDDPQRGVIPLNWCFNANLTERIPHIYDYIFESKKENDFFVMGDNGAGYLNIEQLLDPKRPKGLYGDVESWVAYNQKWNARFDLSVAGYSIFETPLMSSLYTDVLKRIAPDGIGVNSRVQYKMAGNVPVYEVVTAFDNSVNVPYTIDFIHKNTKDVSMGPGFSSYRTIWVKPSQIVEIVKGLKEQFPERKYEVVDPYTFKNLYKQYYGS